MNPTDSGVWLNSPDALLSVGQTAVLAANPAAVRLFGAASAADLAGQSLSCLFPADSEALVLSRVRHVLSGGQPLSGVAERIVRFDGQVRDVEMSAAALSGDCALLAIRDITERRQVEATLAFAAGQLRALAKHQDALVEEERQRISREIHDELGQQLTLAKLRLAALRPAVGESLQKAFDEASTTIDEAIRTVRRIATQLRPALLDALGLAAAAEWQARAFGEQTGIAIIRGPVQELELPKPAATALFRILQEALTNVARHSGASQVRLALYRNQDEAVLEVEDNGRGMDDVPRRAAHSLGLMGMRERATLLGGSLTIKSEPGKGVKLACRVPLDTRDAG
ncbi:MAG: PAS domain-containing sensor histidine kinase [Bryobacteraceae bacterium]|nr:PAS domain-containing sensor histidine kinase [Bryobacteraceae bacterium]